MTSWTRLRSLFDVFIIWCLLMFFGVYGFDLLARLSSITDPFQLPASSGPGLVVKGGLSRKCFVVDRGGYYSDYDTATRLELLECVPGSSWRDLLAWFEEKAAAARKRGQGVEVHFPVLRTWERCSDDTFERIWLVHPLQRRGFLLRGRLDCKEGKPTDRNPFYQNAILPYVLYEFYLGSLLSSGKAGPNPLQVEGFWK
jgi:hypothetical protein